MSKVYSYMLVELFWRVNDCDYAADDEEDDDADVADKHEKRKTNNNCINIYIYIAFWA